MTTLFLLDRACHSISFDVRPDPASAVWFDFQMLDLPSLKFGSIDSIPIDELTYYVKADVKTASRMIAELRPTVVVSAGRACLVHLELIANNEWGGNNVMIDYPGVSCGYTESLLKNKTIYLSSTQPPGSMLALKPPKESPDSGPGVPRGIGKEQIDNYVEQHFN